MHRKNWLRNTKKYVYRQSDPNVTVRSIHHKGISKWIKCCLPAYRQIVTCREQQNEEKKWWIYGVPMCESCSTLFKERQRASQSTQKIATIIRNICWLLLFVFKLSANDLIALFSSKNTLELCVWEKHVQVVDTTATAFYSISKIDFFNFFWLLVIFSTDSTAKQAIITFIHKKIISCFCFEAYISIVSVYCIYGMLLHTFLAALIDSHIIDSTT